MLNGSTIGRHDYWLVALLTASPSVYETNDVRTLLCSTAFHLFDSPLTVEETCLSWPVVAEGFAIRRPR